MLFFWILNPEKSITISTKVLSSTTVLNIYNNQNGFLSIKSAYYYDFWRSRDTEDWSNDAENTALIAEINYILNILKYIETVILNCNDSSQHYWFYYMLINAALVRLLSKHWISYWPQT